MTADPLFDSACIRNILWYGAAYSPLTNKESYIIDGGRIQEGERTLYTLLICEKYRSGDVPHPMDLSLKESNMFFSFRVTSTLGS